MRAVALDVGEKRIGVAGHDDLGLSAQPVAVVHRKGGARDLQAVEAILRERGAELVVVGLPVGLDGREGASARRARSFGEALAARGARVVYWDESFSTATAESVLIEADLSRKRRRQVVDKVAAAVILQSWMDAGAPVEGA